jgi:hypothetical protein
MGMSTTGGASGNQAVTVIVVVACLLSVATILVVGRIYARCVMTQKSGIDDWGTLAAWVIGIP